MNAARQEYFERRQLALDRVRKMIVATLDVRRQDDELDPDVALFGSGLALDSIDAVDLVVQLDVEFNVRLPDDVLGRAEMRTVNGLVNLVLAAQDAAKGTVAQR